MPPDEASPIVVVTCEHGGFTVPIEFREWFVSARTGRLVGTLRTHRGWDPGALDLSRALSAQMPRPGVLIHSTVSRLLIDLNRSPDNPQRWSCYTSGLNERERGKIERCYYSPYRGKVARLVRQASRRGRWVAHVSVHTFTPVLRGVRRSTDIGILFDPARPRERSLSARLRHELSARLPGLRIDFNRPYLGTDDGLTTFLRTFHQDARYAGIELEVSQRLVRRPAGSWSRVRAQIASGCAAALLTGGSREATA